jgi:hypothetical protein
MENKIPNNVIGAVSSVLCEHYFSHASLNSLFIESGAPGDVPMGNCETKCSTWLKACNEDDSIDAISVLGIIIQKYMDSPPNSYSRAGAGSTVEKGQKRITEALSKNQLVYRLNGYITKSGSTPISKTLEDYLKSGDYSSIEKEFLRAVENIQTDPHASVTAACAIIESALKCYIEKFDLSMPQKLNVVPLWTAVQQDLNLNADSTLAGDQHKILKGISSIIDGVGAFRSHIGSAHGRGQNPPQIVVAEARLAVNASHTLVVFIMDTIHANKI